MKISGITSSVKDGRNARFSSWEVVCLVLRYTEVDLFSWEKNAFTNSKTFDVR